MMRIRPPLVVAAPILVMMGWVVSLVIALSRSTEVTLPIRGYDPRDLLRGHYLQYTVDYGLNTQLPIDEDAINRPLAPEYCVCLAQDPSGLAHGTAITPCAERDPVSCPLFIRGQALTWSSGGDQPNWSLIAGIERFYIPDRYQDELATIPDGAKIRVQVTESGAAYVSEMLVGDAPLAHYVRSR